MAPAAATRGASVRRRLGAAAESADVEPGEVGGRRRPRRRSRRSPHGRTRPAERAEAKKRTRQPGSARSSRTDRITVPTCPVAPNTPTHGRRSPTPRGALDGSADRAGAVRPSEAEGARAAPDRVLGPVGADHAGDADRRGGDHLDVDVLLGQDLEHRGGHAGVGLHAGADQRHLGDGVVGQHLAGSELGARAPAHLEPDGQVGSGTVNEMSVVPCSDVFCTIMSTLTLRSARARNSAAATPGWSGTPVTVTLASELSWVDGRDDGLLHGRVLLDDPGARLPREAGADVERHVVVAGELDGAQLRHAAAATRDISSISSKLTVASRRAHGTTRGSAVNTPDTSV